MSKQVPTTDTNLSLGTLETSEAEAERNTLYLHCSTLRESRSDNATTEANRLRYRVAELLHHQTEHEGAGRCLVLCVTFSGDLLGKQMEAVSTLRKFRHAEDTQ